MFKRLAVGVAVASAVCFSAPSASATPIQVYGTWHCGSDSCSWASVRTMADFDAQNHWLVDRGDGHPSVNLVVLSFVNPLKLLNLTTDAGNTQGIPTA